jgi:hypothetical protein
VGLVDGKIQQPMLRWHQLMAKFIDRFLNMALFPTLTKNYKNPKIRQLTSFQRSFQRPKQQIFQP